ncbi:hypothetical protein [Anaerocellum diazotrophicum]|uniref:DRTGG domain-containing protein n=1 Tax=Caldicellulosiruptor diazotrophicus TaxID=2806205 RepID=A0ABM7NMD5_9FIRM|nr:hypothetical protein [Caldicellulosiruptor diazotrophicus]BCS81256.1 hypothetical protein CaldiYA01_12160 [Caldicellulosiruptor diazotrophicus]
MKLTKIKELLNCTVYFEPEELYNEEFLNACGSDLMSDVLAFVKEKVILLTGLVNPQVIRTAEMMDIKAVIIVRGKQPSEEMLKLAKEKCIALLGTDYPMFQACGILYENGLGKERCC